MTNFRKFFDKDFLYSYDLDGKDITVTIEKVTGGEVVGMDGKKSKKPMLHIVGTKKRLALNVTNGTTIETLYGKDVRNWVGKKVTLYPTTTKFGPETKDCIRVRPKVPGDDKPSQPLPDVQPPSDEVK
jgi:hypothetical protein